MGSKATAPYFDRCMAQMLNAAGLLRHGVEMVHDDHAGHAAVIYDSDPQGRSHYHLLRRYLQACSERRVRLSPKKLTVFCRSLEFGGVTHRDGGIKPSPMRYQGMVEQPTPVTLDQVYTGMSSVG